MAGERLSEFVLEYLIPSISLQSQVQTEAHWRAPLPAIGDNLLSTGDLYCNLAAFSLTAAEDANDRRLLVVVRLMDTDNAYGPAQRGVTPSLDRGIERQGWCEWLRGDAPRAIDYGRRQIE